MYIYVYVYIFCIIVCVRTYICRSKYYQFEEYLSVWFEKLKDAKKTPMVVKLMKDVDQYKVLAPHVWK